MKPTKAVQVLAQKLYEVGLEARYRYDERQARPAWSSISEPQRRAWFGVAEYVIRLIGSEEKGR